MRRLKRHIKQVLLTTLVAVFLSSCYDYENHREVCDYKVLLRYDYNEENTSGGVNMIEYYIYTIDEYIFDDAGVLFAQRRTTPDRCREMMNSEWDLPPGRYSVIAVGNQDERSRAWDAATSNAPAIGRTHRDDMRLTLENAATFAGGTKGDSERLYHGYKTFTVKPEGISRVRVDMVNAHMTLRFRIRWKNGASPERGNYYALLESIPSEYSLMPQYIYPKSSLQCYPFDGDVYDEYPSDCNNVIHHIPYTCYPDGQPDNLLTHRYDTYLNADNEIWGEFRTYRIKKTTPVRLLINTTDGQLALPNAVDVTGYLTHFGFTRDDELKQDYEIDILIDGRLIIMNPLDVADWFEGGHM